MWTTVTFEGKNDIDVTAWPNMGLKCIETITIVIHNVNYIIKTTDPFSVE
jgi:hypothetical protein